QVAVALKAVKFVVPVMAGLADTTVTAGAAAAATGTPTSHAAAPQRAMRAPAAAAPRPRRSGVGFVVMYPPSALTLCVSGVNWVQIRIGPGQDYWLARARWIATPATTRPPAAARLTTAEHC